MGEQNCSSSPSLVPSSTRGDVNERTNTEKRPLARFTGVDAEGCNLPHVQGFQSSEQRWTNQWMVDEATPHLLDKDALMMTEITHFDEYMQRYWSAGRRLKVPENKHGQADRHLSKWHKAICCI